MKSVKTILLSIIKVIAVPVIIFLVLMAAYPKNVNFSTFFNVMYQAIAPSVLAWGMLYNIKVNNWDFSVGASAMFAAIYGGQLALRFGLGFAGILVACILLGIICGALNGVLYTVLKIPTIIITVGLCLILEGLSAIGFKGGGVMLTQDMIVLNSFVPQIIFGLAALAIAFVLYNYLPVGYHIRAVGSSSAIAVQKGINVMRVKVSALIIAGMFAGLYAAVTLGTSGVYRPATNSMGTLNTCFDAMMCVFVGMCLENAANLVISVYIGAVILKYVKLTLMLVGTQSAYDQIFIAAFVLVVLCYSTWREKTQAEKIYKHRTLTNIKI